MVSYRISVADAAAHRGRQLILGKTAAQQHMCAQRQGTGSGQLRAPLRQVDGGVTEKGGRDRVVEDVDAAGSESTEGQNL